MNSRARCIALLALLVGVSAPAGAILHEWDIAEIYSNADGSVQYIEFFTTGADEFGWSAGQIRSLSNESMIEFDTNLEPPTENRRVLVATPGFADLPGAVAPDYEIPAGFFDIGGDTLVFSNVDTVTFASGQLPTDGTQSLYRTLTLPSPSLPTVAGPEDLFVGENSPTNFAGETGQLVPEPGALALGLSALCALGSAAAVRRSMRPRP
jgi:hypothetical protein